MGLEKINKFKKEKKLTNKKLSELSGIPKSSIDKITSGLNQNPPLETVKAIARALGRPLSDFFGAEDISGAIDGSDFIHIHDGAISKYDELSNENKKIIDKNIEYLLHEQNKE